MSVPQIVLVQPGWLDSKAAAAYLCYNVAVESGRDA
jgi:hypothetical protein